jgi:phage shock protein PspC (stress-responsive transcriptional regulator)
MDNTTQRTTVNLSEHATVTETDDTQGSEGLPNGQVRPTLYRHPTDALVGGVCGGIADYFGWDPALVRILWVVLTFASGGGGLLAYLALWILLPVGTTGDGQQRPAAFELNERNLGRAAILLISLGLIWLLANLGILPWLWGSFWRTIGVIFWPALLIGAGYVLLRKVSRNDWRMNLGNAAGRVKNGVNGRVPTRSDISASLRDLRDRFPLKRSRQDRMFMGVCGGIGRALGIDANLVRLIWAAFSIGSIGMGVLIYIIAGLVLPEAPVTAIQPYDEQDVQVIDISAGRTV